MRDLVDLVPAPRELRTDAGEQMIVDITPANEQIGGLVGELLVGHGSAGEALPDASVGVLDEDTEAG